MAGNKNWEPSYRAPGPGCTPIGFAHLVAKYRLDVIGHSVWTFVKNVTTSRELVEDGMATRIWPFARHPGPRDVDHLLFAVRHEGPSLPICRALFAETSAHHLAGEIIQEVRARPTSAFRRRVWFLWEELTGERLPLPDLDRGNYVPLLDPLHFVTARAVKHPRQRIDVNLLGSLALSPMVRRTPRIDAALGRPISAALEHDLEAVLGLYDETVMRRALSYLYTRETRASFAIENEQPSRHREERFLALLRRAPTIEHLDQDTLVEMQNATVDPRFADTGWRKTQIYVGETVDLRQERIHYVGPKPEDVPPLMSAFLELAVALIDDSGLDAVLVAAVISFLFVLIHPFEDGNGRLHRWLIHWALARRGVVRRDVVLPVSAVIEARRLEYDLALESFSRPLVRRLVWELSEDGRMTVEGPTADFYRHPDLTAMAEALIEWLEQTIQGELRTELDFLVRFDRAKRALQETVDMPDRLIELFIKLCRQGRGQLSARKREAHFAMLTDEEIERMEQAVRGNFGLECS
ncbi:MAG: Fic family protein [Thermoanaerobaculia bacterium]|nr:Fic family protein [Thermoanaerobaculia bacterium]